MAETPPKTPSESNSGLQADAPQDNRSSLLHLDLPATGSDLSLGRLFVTICEHLESLREGGHNEEADEMDNSVAVAGLIGIAGEQTWKAFDAIWSAKGFREVLYHAVAAKYDGPLWLRQGLKIKVAEEMCMTLIPHVSSRLLSL